MVDVVKDFETTIDTFVNIVKNNSAFIGVETVYETGGIDIDTGVPSPFIYVFGEPSSLPGTTNGHIKKFELHFVIGCTGVNTAETNRQAMKIIRDLLQVLYRESNIHSIPDDPIEIVNMTSDKTILDLTVEVEYVLYREID